MNQPLSQALGLGFPAGVSRHFGVLWSFKSVPRNFVIELYIELYI
jgi:hypothetical protein